MDINILPNLLSDINLFSDDVLLRDASIELLKVLVASGNASTVSMAWKCCISDVLNKLARRSVLRDDRKESGTEAVLGYPDAQGWASLETSLKGVWVILTSVSSSFDGLDDLLTILGTVTEHTNRFAREYGQMCLAEVIRIRATHIAHDEAELLRYVRWTASGLQDNWSQVRYAAVASTRCLIRACLLNNRMGLLTQEIVPLLLLNRHFVAEGVKRFSQETWRMLVGPQGGSLLVASTLSVLLTYLATAIDSPNHSVREAVGCCLAEVCRKVIPLHSTCRMSDDDVSNLIRICVATLEDDSWPVRELGAQCTLVLFRVVRPAFTDKQGSAICSRREQFVSLLYADLFDPMIPLRASASDALGFLISSHVRDFGCDSLWTECLDVLQRGLVRWRQQQGASGSPFRVISFEESQHENRPMYSCGSLVDHSAVRRVRHSLSDDCCTGGHCDIPSISQPWEVTDGAVRLFSSLLWSHNLSPELTVDLAKLCVPLIAEVLRDDGATSKQLHRTIVSSLANVVESEWLSPSNRIALWLTDGLRESCEAVTCDEDTRSRFTQACVQLASY